MIHAIPHQVHDPLLAALPVLAVFIAIETIAYMFEGTSPPLAAVSSAIDSRTSIARLAAL